MSKPTTVQLPSESKADTKVELPAWMNTAGEEAVGIASGIAKTPYPEYAGDLVAPISQTTQGAINAAKNNTAGSAATTAAATGTANATKAAAAGQKAGQSYLPGIQSLVGGAGDIANMTTSAGQDYNAMGGLSLLGGMDYGFGSTGAGMDAMGGANDTGNLADLFSRLGMTAGSDLSSMASGMASDNRYAGGEESDAASAGALGNIDVASGDLNAARDYTGKMASKITGDDIAGYMNPYTKLALDPAAKLLQRDSDIRRQELKAGASMRESFGGGRQSALEGANEFNLDQALSGLYGKGYADSYDKGYGAAADERTRYGQAAGLSLNTAGAASGAANEAIQRLLSTGKLKSDLATAGQERLGSAASLESGLTSSALQRLLSSSSNLRDLGATESGMATEAQNRIIAPAGGLMEAGRNTSALASDAIGRLTGAAGAGQSAAQNESGLASQNVDRLLSTISPNLATAQLQMQKAQADIDNQLKSGAIEQTQAQNMLDAEYQKYLDERNWAANQLNALISTLSGTPYSTTTTSNQSGYTTGQGASPLSQLAGGAMAGAAMMSLRESKEEIAALNDEDVLDRIARLDTFSYRYKPEYRTRIGDDGRVRIGPMADDWAREFGGNGNVIPMPETIGALISSVKALEKRTRKSTSGALALAA